jgi:hypothetical protein
MDLQSFTQKQLRSSNSLFLASHAPVRLTSAYPFKTRLFLTHTAFLAQRCYREQVVNPSLYLRPLRKFLATSYPSKTMADSESDDDLQRAIALSLEENSPPTRKLKPATVIDLTVSDEEHDDDLDAPVTTRIKKQQHAPALGKDIENTIQPQGDPRLHLKFDHMITDCCI